MNFNAELEANTFAKLVEANTDATHLPALIFSAAEFTLRSIRPSSSTRT